MNKHHSIIQCVVNSSKCNAFAMKKFLLIIFLVIARSTNYGSADNEHENECVYKNIYRQNKEMVALTISDCDDDAIFSAPYHNTRSLKNLTIAHNRIADINETHMNNFRAVEYLELRDNQIKKFSPNALYPLYEFLEELRIAEPQLELHIDSTARYLKKLKVVYFELKSLTDESINNFPNTLVRLTIVDTVVGKNNKFEMKRDFTSLSNLTLRNCNLNKTDLQQCGHSLVYLDLSLNHLSSDINRIGALPNLINFNLAFNNYTQISHSDLVNKSSLEVLNLSHNSIQFVHSNAFIRCPQLQQVNFEHNQLLRLTLNFNNQKYMVMVDNNHFICDYFGEYNDFQRLIFNKSSELGNVKGLRCSYLTRIPLSLMIFASIVLIIVFTTTCVFIANYYNRKHLIVIADSRMKLEENHTAAHDQVLDMVDLVNFQPGYETDEFASSGDDISMDIGDAVYE